MITVFTPTYNRAYIIRALYESLCRQSSKNFEWIVVDDGSTDDTRELIHSFVEEELIPIRYFYQENSGKHIAINKGVQEARGELFFIVDSDDYLADNAIEEMWECYVGIAHDDRFAGISGVRVTPQGRRIGGEVNYGVMDCSLLDFIYKHKYAGDMAEAYKTAILRLYPFPRVEGEKFCSEAYVWAQIAQKYLLRYTQNKWYVCDYQPDGLTANSVRARVCSPTCAVLVYLVLLKSPIPLAFRFRYGINLWRFALCSRASFLFALTKAPWLSYTALPVAILMHIGDLKLIKNR